MTKRERPGYATLTLEVPVEVAEWLAVSGEHLGQIAALAAAKARRNSEATKLERKNKSEQRQAELWHLGRTGYRHFRRFNGGKNVAKRIELVREIAVHLGCDPQVLKLSIVRFKRDLEKRASNRRGREIARLCAAGFSNGDIASRYRVHPNTVVRYLSKHKDDVKAYLRALPENANTLKLKEKGKLPGKSLGSRDPIPWEAIKQAGRRA